MNKVSAACLSLVIALGSIGGVEARSEPARLDKSRLPAKRHKFKNVPTIEAMPEGIWAITEEVNVFSNIGVSNTTIDYGFPNGWNTGISLLNVNFYRDEQTRFWDPDVLLNLEKAFPLTPAWSVILGTQTGAAFWDPERSSKIENYTYLDNQVATSWRGVLFHVGGYYTNRAFAGPGDSFGYLLGARWPLWEESLQLFLDYISGNSGVSAGAAGVLWAFSHHWQLAIGVQVPAPGSPNDYSGLIGLAWR